MSEKQPVDDALKRIEYKIEKSVPKTNRESIEKEVELKNIKQLRDKNN